MSDADDIAYMNSELERLVLAWRDRGIAPPVIAWFLASVAMKAWCQYGEKLAAAQAWLAERWPEWSRA